MKKRCKHCGKVFEAKRANKKYCSERCAHQAMYIRYKSRNGKKVEKKKKCIICGKVFESSHASMKYCSAECRRTGEKRNEERRKKAAMQSMDKPRECPVCGHMFLPTVWNQEGCNNPACRKELKRRKARLDYKEGQRSKGRKIKYGSKAFYTLPFEKQWELMSLAERNDYARKQHKSYGQLQVIYYGIVEGGLRCRKN